MNVYDSLIKETLDILKKQDCTELKVHNCQWNMLNSNEFLMGKEVSFFAHTHIFFVFKA